MYNPLRLCTDKMKVFIREVLKGTEPLEAARIAYPKAINPDVQLVKLFNNQKVQHALKVMSRHGVNEDAKRIRLNAIINDPDSKNSEVLQAIKMLRLLDEHEPEAKNEKKTAKKYDGADVDLQSKLKELGDKAARPN